jgi:hypothetical protein
MPRSSSISSTRRRLKGKRKYSHTHGPSPVVESGGPCKSRVERSCHPLYTGEGLPDVNVITPIRVLSLSALLGGVAASALPFRFVTMMRISFATAT